MKAFIVLALVAVSRAAVISPYAAGLPLAGLPLSGLPLSGLPLSGLPLSYAAGYAPTTLTYAAPTAAKVIAAAPAPIIKAYAAPAPTYAAPIVAAPALIPTPSSQYQAQDEFGNLQYGYSNINSAKQETGNSYTGVSGSYSYVDANGQVQTTNYIADGLGFRVQATNLPVAPVADLRQPVFDLVGPAPVEDTPEVKAAKAEFQKAFDEAESRHKRSTPASTAPLLPYAPLSYAHAGLPLNYGYAGLPFNYGYNLNPYTYGVPAYTTAAYSAPALTYAAAAAPVATLPYAAPAAVVASAPELAEATLTKIQLNPGHAVAYKVE